MNANDSPCIGICSTVYGDDICRGCKRHFKEVIDWNGYPFETKEVIHERLLINMEKITARFLFIENPDRLKQALDKAALKPPLYNSPFYWAHELLRLRAPQIQRLSDVGLRAIPPYHLLSPNALFTALDETLYSQSLLG